MKVAFYKAKGDIINFLIRLRTGSSYSHTELVFSDGIAFSSSERDGGTRFKEIDFKVDHWDFLELDISKAAEKKIRNFCKKHEGVKYDWKAIVFAQILNFNLQSKEAYFCSEFCTKALQQIKLLVGTSTHFIDPGDLYNLLLEEKVVSNRHWLKMKMKQNADKKIDSWGGIFGTSLGITTLVLAFSYFANPDMLKAFLASVL